MSTETLTELLIAEYAKRPPLYNEKLPLVERSRRVKTELEWEVYHALKGQMPLVDIPKKWAYLKKEYKKQKAILHKYVQRGCSYEEAAKKAGKTLWVHFHALEFIDEYIIKRKPVKKVQKPSRLSMIGTQNNTTSVNTPSQNETNHIYGQPIFILKKPPFVSCGESVSGCASTLTVLSTYNNTTSVNTLPQKETVDSPNHNYEKPILIMKKSPSASNSESSSGYSSALSTSDTYNNATTSSTPSQEETLDSTDHFCKMLSLEMKKLTPRQKAKLQIKYLELLQNVLYEDED